MGTEGNVYPIYTLLAAAMCNVLILAYRERLGKWGYTFFQVLFTAAVMLIKLVWQLPETVAIAAVGTQIMGLGFKLLLDANTFSERHTRISMGRWGVVILCLGVTLLVPFFVEIMVSGASFFLP